MNAYQDPTDPALDATLGSLEHFSGVFLSRHPETKVPFIND